VLDPGIPWRGAPGVRTLWLRWVAWRNESPARQPTEIKKGLWIGGVASPERWRTLQGAGVAAVLTLAHEFPPPAWYRTATRLLWLPVCDGACPSPSQFAAGCDFLDGCRAAGLSVFVSCGAGIGRAPTLYTAWRARSGMTVADTLRTVRELRPITNPTANQLTGLKTWEANARLSADTHLGSAVGR